MKFCIFILGILSIQTAFSNNEIDSKPIATTGSDKDLSVGWDKIAIRTQIGDTLSINTSHDTGEITDFVISGRFNKNVDLDLFDKVRFPDFRTLNDVWYDHKLEKVNLIKFEFSYLYIDEKFIEGQYMAKLYFEHDKVDLIIWKLNPDTKAWEKI